MAEAQQARIPTPFLPYSTILVAAGLILFGVIAGLVKRSEFFVVYVFGSIGAILLGLGLLWIGTETIVKRLRRREIEPAVRSTMVILASSIASILLFISISWAMDRWRVSSVENYVSKALPVLDQMKARDGVYPQMLPDSVLGPPPELLRKYAYGGYQSDGKTYRFTYVHSFTGLEDQTILTDTERYWHGED